MKCPQCGNEMVEGRIPGDRYRLKFRSDNIMTIEKDNLVRYNLFGAYIPLTEAAIFTKSFKCFYCSKCKIILGKVNFID